MSHVGEQVPEHVRESVGDHGRETDHAACRGSRRAFLALSAGVVSVSAVPSVVRGSAGPGAEIRIGLIGCGGRGTGAAIQAAAADPGVRIVALGDAFPDQVSSAAQVLGREATEQFACPASARFSGADAYRRVLEAGIDAVLIAAPPHLRPLHVEAAVAGGVHVFCETPAAIDVAGGLRVARALAAARAAGLAVASGLHARRDDRVAAVVDEVRAGAIGRPRAVGVHATRGLPWRLPARTGWTAAEDRLRNWISDDTLSGGHFVERHVHAIDRALWLLGDCLPEVAEPIPGDAAHRAGVAVRYRFVDGAEVRASSFQDGAAGGDVGEIVVGTRGVRRLSMAADGRRFQATMDAFLRSIRSASGMDDAGILVRASLVAIMGRAAATSGRRVAWRDVVGADTLVFPVDHIGTNVNLAPA